MTRWPIRILICLLLGVVTTVGVAWGLAASVDVYKGQEVEILPRQPYMPNASGQTWIDHTTPLPFRFHYRHLGGWYVVRADVPSRDFRVMMMSSLINPAPRFDDECPAWGDEQAPLPTGTEKVFAATGLPFLALLRITTGKGPPWTVVGAAPSSVAKVSLAARMPLRPIWTGFLINTLVYGAIWIGLLSASPPPAAPSVAVAVGVRGAATTCGVTSTAAVRSAGVGDNYE